ncbi:hypothetical protein H6G20_07280 [Desertifilum sp. FACHB-1129]|uniref:Alginate lyase domain-containing protein n=1 Tax=Desertifilum tharense IPPAS B-1220 TaxID=1781255 RepID=A0A1E5QF42_9CYAN|nr:MULTISPECIES: hypothetical protein [Desertifilum]MDA0213003.1 hypothetical protein [Cyanobacteria bacterium FC1]MBD2311459.1 hypothetical protein [Desertifilum sp. FACHB-1129]MBD2323369.1 hypothetical protein [Desertifilum sp. FACHB-866]MBD2333214.1 hypothetical protein [Desertifilum sp. FACHB-868]OEJ73221.1 hypothetical protein BH720_20865 [Desertifilum tharense IPPAS B-1220]
MRSQWLTIPLISLYCLSTQAAYSQSFERTPALFRQRIQFLKTDFQLEASPLIANVLYRQPDSLYRAMSETGAYGVNAQWERGEADTWFIEAQRQGEEALVAGVVRGDRAAIDAAFKMFAWGFSRQSADGSFAGTGDPFHSTSFFVQAVARSLLILQQSPYAEEYAAQIAYYQPLVHRAAQWMIQPEVWQRGSNNNQPYTHRRYLVACALGLTSLLSGDRALMEYAQFALQEGLLLQQPDGIYPEMGGFDSSYQMASVLFAGRWVAYFPTNPLTPQAIQSIEKALTWQHTRLLPWGEIRSSGNSRTAHQEIRRTGQVKQIDYRTAFRGFAYWASLTGSWRWGAIARRIAQYHYKVF